MQGLLDQAIKVGKDLAGADKRIQALRQQEEDLQHSIKQQRTEATRQASELISTAESHANKLRQEITRASRDLERREAEVKELETATHWVKHASDELKEQKVTLEKAQHDASKSWREAKAVESHWHTRNAELDAKADAINEQARKLGVQKSQPTR